MKYKLLKGKKKKRRENKNLEEFIGWRDIKTCRAASRMCRQGGGQSNHVTNVAGAGVAGGDGDDDGGDDRNRATRSFKKKEKMTVDITLALFDQVGLLTGDMYGAWVHQPSSQRAFRMFKSPLLEAGSKTPWWLVLLLWPWIATVSFASSLQCADPRQQNVLGFSCAGPAGLQPAAATVVAGVGVIIWTLIEYVLHRAVFHYPTKELSPGWWIKLHFLLHGQHHKFPLDNQRLVFPIVPAGLIAGSVYVAFRMTLPFAPAHALFAGVLVGYVSYVTTS